MTGLSRPETATQMRTSHQPQRLKKRRYRPLPTKPDLRRARPPPRVFFLGEQEIFVRPGCRLRLRRVRLRAHAKTKLTIRPPGREQATRRKEQLDEILDGKRNRNLRRQLRHGRLLLVLRAEADVRSSPRCAGGVSSALAAHTSRRPTRLLQDCDAAFSGRLPEAFVDRVPRRVRRWPRAVAAHGTASDRA